MGLNALMRLSQHVAFQTVRVECHLTFVLNQTLKAKKKRTVITRIREKWQCNQF